MTTTDTTKGMTERTFKTTTTTTTITTTTTMNTTPRNMSMPHNMFKEALQTTPSGVKEMANGTLKPKAFKFKVLGSTTTKVTMSPGSARALGIKTKLNNRLGAKMT